MADGKIRIEVVGESGDLQAALRRSRDSIRGVGDESDRQTTRAGRHFDRLRAKLRQPIRAKVEAQTAQAQSQLEALHARIKELQREKAEIKATADTSQADARLSALRGEMRKLERQKIKLGDADTTEIDAKIAKVTADIRELERERAEVKLGADTSEVDRKLAAARAEVRRFGQESATASAGVNRLGGSIGQTNQKFMLLRNGMRLLKWPALIAALGTAIQMFSALGAGAIALTSALAPLSGVLVAYPGFLAAIAQGMNVWKLATGGLKEALGGLHEKLDTNSEAFKKLSPAAQDFARYLQQIKPHFRSLQQTAQQGLFPGLREGLSAAMKNFPVLERVVGRTARALGDLAASAGKALGSAEWGRDMETIGNANVVIMTRLGRAAGNVANAFRHIWVAAAPTLKKLAGDVTNVTQKLEESAAAGRKSGGLADFFERARVKLHQFSRIVADVAVGLGNVFKAGGPTGDRLLASIERVADRWAKWTGSVQGQNHLRRYFEQAEPGIRQMGGLLADVTKMFLRLGASKGLAPLIAQIRRDLLPAIESIIRTFTTTVGPAFVNLATQLAKLFEALAPHIAAVVKVIASLAAGLAAVIRQVPGIGAMTAGVIGLGVAFKALKLIGVIGGLKVILGLLGKFRGAGAAAAGALGGIAGRNAALAKGGAKAGAGWAAAFKKALKGAGIAAVIAGIIDTASKVPGALKAIGPTFQRINATMKSNLPIQEKLKRSWAAYVGAMRQMPVIGPLIKNVEKLARAVGLMGDKGKKARSDVARLAPAIRNAIRTNDVAALKRYGVELGKLGPEAAKSAARVKSALKNAATGNDATWKRWAKGMSGIPKAAEGAVGRMLRVFRRIPKVQKWVLKTNEPEVAAKLARITGKLRNLGRTRTVAEILATSKNLDQAVRRSQALLKRVHNKKARAILDALDRTPGKVRDVLRRLVGLGRKRVKSVLDPDPKHVKAKVADVLKRLRKVHRTTTNPKIKAETKEAMKDLERVMKMLKSVNAYKANPKVVVQQMRGRRQGRPRGPGGAGYAEGGIADAPTRKSTGGRHSRPTFLVGEENRPEYVIATNPRYRKANLGYLRAAAHALGVVPGFARGGEKVEDPYASEEWYGPNFGKSRKEIAKERAEKLKEKLGTYKELADTLAEHRSIGRIPAGGDARGWGRWMAARRRGDWATILGEKLREGVHQLAGHTWAGREDHAEDVQARVERLLELWSTIKEIRQTRRAQRALTRRVTRAQMPAIAGFAQERGLSLLPPSLENPAAAAAAMTNSRDRRAAVARLPHPLRILHTLFAPYAGSFARGTGGRTIKRSGLGVLHRGEIVRPSPTGPYGSQVAPSSPRREELRLKLELDTGGLVRVVDAQIDGRSAQVSSREIGRRQRMIKSAPGQTRAAFAR